MFLIQPKYMSENIHFRARFIIGVFARTVPQIHHRDMEEFIDNLFCEDVDFLPHVGREMVDVFLYLGVADRFELLAELLNSGGNIEGFMPHLELRDFIEDDALDLRDLGFSVRKIVVDNVIESVNIVKEYILDGICLGIDIARHADIDDEQRFVAPRFHCLADVVRR